MGGGGGGSHKDLYSGKKHMSTVLSDEAVQNDTEKITEKINDKTIQNIEKSKQNARPFEEETQQEIIKKRIDGLEEKFEELLVKTSQIRINE